LRALRKALISFSEPIVHLYTSYKIEQEKVVRAWYRLYEKEIFDDILLDTSNLYDTDIELPWVKLIKLFTIAGNEYLLATKYTLFDRKAPLCVDTGCPYVRLMSNSEKNFLIILPVQCIKTKIQVIYDDRAEYFNNENFWINWWVDMGTFIYPHADREYYQHLWKWRNE